MSFSPFMGSISVGVAPVRLSTALAAIDANLSTRLQFLRIEYDIAGTSDLYIGRSNVDATHCGAHLVPSQFKDFVVFGGGLVLSSDVYLVAGAAAQQVNITAIPAGA